MRRLYAPFGAAILLLLTAACAGENAGGPPAIAPTGDAAMVFQARAAQIAEAWRAAPDAERWRTGFVPLQDLTVLTERDPGFTDETKQAFLAGWFRSTVKLPGKAGSGSVTFPDGQRMTVPLVSAASAYAALDQGDAPPCLPPGAQPAVPPTKTPGTVTGPDDNTGTLLPQSCATLTVTAARLDTVNLRTSRGEATVPAYLFTVRGLRGQVARVAVDQSAIGKSSVDPVPDDLRPPNLRSVQGLTRVDGTTLEYQLGLGACDVDVKPLFAEYDDVVVVGGTARTEGDVCTDQLVLKPVSVTLAKPLGDRIVLDSGTGAPQSLITQR